LRNGTAKVAILGASGYTGRELLHLLARHPAARAEVVMTSREGSVPEPPELPSDPVVDSLDLRRLDGIDVAFLCAPHGASARLARQVLDAGTRVIDLSADFRLRDARLYAETYGEAHPARELLGRAVYGLTEHAREHLEGARLVANPGCYPTSILLPLLPLLQHGLVDEGATVIADSKSGVSGAGKALTERTHFGNVHDNFLAYKVGDHRHLPEIQQQAGTDRIVFVPHLLPVFRGILSTLYVPPARGTTAAQARACLEEVYAAEPFVRVYGTGLPELRAVVGTNFCDIGVAAAGDRIVVISAIDNLVKGASGQAVQNMNVMLGLEETAGLR
jgi:N-acetyl-gamma-glutamyl-phosphate reductase